MTPLGSRSSVSLTAAQRRRRSGAVTVLSAVLCLLLLPVRLPGMEILGVAPNWPLIWVVAWGVKRSAWDGAIAGIVMGLLQDSMTASHPTHMISLAVVGVLTALLQKQRYIQEDIVSVALIVFAMAIIGEAIREIDLTGAKDPVDAFADCFPARPST